MTGNTYFPREALFCMLARTGGPGPFIWDYAFLMRVMTCGAVDFAFIVEGKYYAELIFRLLHLVQYFYRRYYQMFRICRVL